jgi:ribonuclease PH
MAPGSVLIKTGRTHVLCTASISTALPEWRASSGKGWLTGEYEMLPGSTPSRKVRSRDRLDGRTQEIQRLIGRSLRAVVDFVALGPHLITVDCDVLQADGGTRTAAITGAYVALSDAVRVGRERELWGDGVLKTQVAAISVAVRDGELLLDPDYEEDVAAAADCNLVMTGRGEWIEVQSTGERTTFTDEQLIGMLALGRRGIEGLMERQRAALAD